MYTIWTVLDPATPTPSSYVAPHNRIDFLTHASFVKHLSGDGLHKLYARWSESFSRRLHNLDIGSDWKEFPDIMELWMPAMTASLNEAIAGPLLEVINPNFTTNFLKLLPFVHLLFKHIPRTFIPEAYRLQKSLIQDVQIWQNLARARFQEKDVEGDGDADPWWGSLFIRERQSFLTKVDGWNAQDVAISDFGLLWGANINLHTAAIWAIVEIFKDHDLLKRVRLELEEARFDGIESKSEIEMLVNLPLLQSVYAEVLRLRVEAQHVLYSDVDDIKLNGWLFPKKSLIAVPTWEAHMDNKVWNTHSGRYPLDTFWADRFLVYPDDPLSGPLNKSAVSSRADAENTTTTVPTNRALPSQSKSKGKFKEGGTADIFIPYGVGERTCPGRFFAKRKIIAFCALVVNNYEIEVPVKHYQTSGTFYGIGVQHPLSPISFQFANEWNDQFRLECFSTWASLFAIVHSVRLGQHDS